VIVSSAVFTIASTLWPKGSDTEPKALTPTLAELVDFFTS
jgi:hypothetical protein